MYVCTQLYVISVFMYIHGVCVRHFINNNKSSITQNIKNELLIFDYGIFELLL